MTEEKGFIGSIEEFVDVMANPEGPILFSENFEAAVRFVNFELDPWTGFSYAMDYVLGIETELHRILNSLPPRDRRSEKTTRALKTIKDSLYFYDDCLCVYHAMIHTNKLSKKGLLAAREARERVGHLIPMKEDFFLKRALEKLPE